MSQKRNALLGAALLVLAFAVAPSLHAQAVSTGTVVGQVTDPSNSAVAGASVALTDLSTNATRSNTTNPEGRFIFVNINPGFYSLTVTAKGFRAAKIAKAEVTVGTQLTLNVQLQIGVATEVVEVTAGSGAELQTLNSTVNTSFSGVAVDSLPAIGRDVATFVTLQPGVSPDGSVAGAVFDQNTYQLDGGQNTNDMDGGFGYYSIENGDDLSNGIALNCFTCAGAVPSGVMPTPIDSIEEFKVSTTQQTADFNSSAGAQISIVTRRGRDAWHGTGYEYYLDNNWNANTFANNSNTPVTKIASYHYSRFGGAGGGPIIPKKILGGKTYFFGNYEGFRFPNSTTMLFNTPGPGMRLGLLSFATCTSAPATCGTPAEVDTQLVYNLNPAAVAYAGPTIASGGITGLMTGVTYQPGVNPVAGGLAAPVSAGCTGTVNPSCDPRNLGISPTMQALWALMPQGNYKDAMGFKSTGAGNADGINILGFQGNVTLPTRTDFAVARIDHDFGEKEHFFATWRYYKLTRLTTNQVQLTPTGIVALANRPQTPWFYAAGLTSNITTSFTNDFHYSFLRNWWLWGDKGAPPQLAGLGAALEPGGDGLSNTGTIPDLLPYNVNNQDIRQRYWDGMDHLIRDDMTRLLGNHLLQWGGSFQHNYNQHSRNDNGVETNEYPTYVLANGQTSPTDNGLLMTGFFPRGVSSGSFFANDYAMVLGLLGESQFVGSRAGPQLTLQPPLTPVVDRSRILYYNTYFTDSWHIRPTIQLTYGLAWTVEMPPKEQTGEQVILVNDQNQPIVDTEYLATRKAAALAGQVYNPTIGYALVTNAGGGMKYPFHPYYGQFSPRLAVAWSPNYDSGILGSVLGRNKTVIRGGFAQIYGRINGVNLVLVPLLGYGLLQGVQCFGPTFPLATGVCAGTDMSTPVNGFRIGPGASGAGQWDGLVAPLAKPSPTLPQPAFPGISPTSTGPALPAGGVQTLDPNFRPNKSYEMNFTIQRQIGSKMTVEAGYIGRVIRNEYQQIDLNSVPYMFTLGGQQFQNAYANVVMAYCGGVKGLAGGGCAANAAAVMKQPFFEAALGGPASNYCKAFANCTAAVVANEGANLAGQKAWAVWSDLDAGPFQAFNGGALSGPTMMQNANAATGVPGQLSSDGIGTITSLGYGNFNSLFLSARMSDWRGLTMQSNFTYGKALGTGALSQPSGGGTVADPFDIGRAYGLQNYDRKFVFNTFLVYQPPYYKSQHGVVGHLLGGWTFAPVVVLGSGNPLSVFSANNSDFGQSNAVSFAANDQAVLIPGCSGYQNSTSRHGKVPGSAGVGVATAFAINLFSNPAAEFSCFRNPVLGFDNGNNGGFGDTLRGLTYWNADMQIRKTTNVTERVSVEFQIVFANLFNHNQFYDPSTNLGLAPFFGALNTPVSSASPNGGFPRRFEFGGRIRF